MLSQQSKYAVRGVIYLAIHASKSRKIGSREVGDNINVPLPFLAKIFQKLNKEKLITSSKGPKGGFFLNQDQLAGNLFSVITCIDGEDHFNSCFLGLPQCSDKNPCAVHRVTAPLRDSLIKEFRKKSILDFANETKNRSTAIF